MGQTKHPSGRSLGNIATLNFSTFNVTFVNFLHFCYMWTLGGAGESPLNIYLRVLRDKIDNSQKNV